MTAKRVAGAMMAALFISTASSSAGDLLTYVQAPDESFRWEKVSQADVTGGVNYTLKMTSQTWQGIPWTHEIELVRPAKCEYPSTAVLFVTGGHPSPHSSTIAMALAGAAGCPIAVLYAIPNQPLFDGKKEDALIAYTFGKMLETSDDTWPLLFPMTKAALRAMDAVQAFSKSELGCEIASYIVTGASKRGWTTWLTAAADRERVKAIMPMVYDNLNLPAQMERQIAYWGKYSDEIEDYTRDNLQESMITESGKRLAQIVDPWAYRERITVPKLIVNGTNDAYWTVDALNLYWGGLKGPKYVLYIPNAGHNVDAIPAGAIKLLSTSAAFVRAIASGRELPKLTWKPTVSKNGYRLHITTDPKASDALVWTAGSDSLDFRQSRWESTPMKPTGNGFTATVAAPTKGYLAVFGEVTVPIGGLKSQLSTQVTLIGPGGTLSVRGPSGGS